MLKELMENPYMWAFITLFGLITGLLTIYTWITGKVTKSISISCISTSIVEKSTRSMPKLKIEYDRKRIRELTISNIYIWNGGKVVINRQDIATKDPLKIKNTGKVDILDAKIIKCSNPVNSVSILQSSADSVVLDFEFLDPSDGFVVQIIHTGPPVDLELVGTIKDKGEIKDRSPFSRKTKPKFKDKISDVLIIAVPTCVAMFSYVLTGKFSNWIVNTYDVNWFWQIIAALLILAVPGFTVWASMRLFMLLFQKNGVYIPNTLQNDFEV